MLSNWALQKMTRNPLPKNDVESFWNETLYPTAGRERVGVYLHPSAREPVQTYTAPRHPIPANHQNKRRQNSCVLRTGNGEILTKFHKTSFGRDTAISMIEITIQTMMLNVSWLVLTVSVFSSIFISILLSFAGLVTWLRRDWRIRLPNELWDVMLA